MKISEEKIAAFYTWMTGIGIVIMLSLIAMVNLFHYCYKMNADIASEAVLAQLIWESGEWLPKTWYASTELRIFSTPNLASFFYGLTGSMNWAMGISCTLMTMGIMVSAYFFTGQMEFCRQSRLLFLLLCLLIPNHFVTLELMYLFAGYYSIHIIILFVILGIYAKLQKRVMKGERLPGGLMIVSWLLSFCMGMQGVRGILILSGPLVVLEIIRNGYFIAVKNRTMLGII